MLIKRFAFDEKGRDEVAKLVKGKDWPVVYLIHNKNELYIGETTSAYIRFGQHLVNPDKGYLETVDFVFDDTFNKSVILDFEQKLIRYCKADGTFARILNRNAGQSSQHNYYQRDTYAETFKQLWLELFNSGLVQNSMDIIENKNIFKFSPYNSLTEEQNEISVAVIKDILTTLSANRKGISLINGCAGTGKTVLAINIINSIVNSSNLKPEDFTADELGSEKIEQLFRIKKYQEMNGTLKIGFVFPMSGIRETIKKVFQDFGSGLSAEMVISPYELSNKEFDILFVDESHRLACRKNLINYDGFDTICRKFALDKNVDNQLDWVLLRAKHIILFYDRDQSIKSSDITHSDYTRTISKYNYTTSTYQLTTQMRCLGGMSYVNYVKRIMTCRANEFLTICNYEFLIFDDVDQMISRIRDLDNKFSLCKTVAGYSWKWQTKPEKTPKDDWVYYEKLVKEGKYDICINGHKYIWNLTTKGWLNRLDSHKTIGCIHTTQGYDLNYVGVIFGREIDYNPATNSIEIDLDLFFDKNVKAGCDEQAVKEYILNTYTTMLSRGIKGCYVYACNKNLRDYLHRFIKNA